MASNETLQELLNRWMSSGEELRREALRLEKVDRDRHAVSITMLEAKAQGIDRCIFDLTTALSQ